MNMSSLMDRFSAVKAEVIEVAGIELGARLLTPKEFAVVCEKLEDPAVAEDATEEEIEEIAKGHNESMSIVVAELFVELDDDGKVTDKLAFTPEYIRDSLPTIRAKQLLEAFLAANGRSTEKN
jgi:hypothetical protein